MRPDEIYVVTKDGVFDNHEVLGPFDRRTAYSKACERVVEDRDDWHEHCVKKLTTKGLVLVYSIRKGGQGRWVH